MSQSTLDRWMGLSREELDELYRAAPAGSVPRGDTRGTAIVAGSRFSRVIAHVARRLAWQGKVFDVFADNGQSGVLINKVLPLGLGLIVAKVYLDTSWLDGKETIVIDYSRTSLLARVIRDEIREVEPGLYLGKVWWGKTRVLDFALTATESSAQQPPPTPERSKAKGTEAKPTDRPTEDEKQTETTPA